MSEPPQHPGLPGPYASSGPGYAGAVQPEPLPPGQVPVAAPVPPKLPVEPTEYHHFLRTPGFSWWRPLASLGLFGVGFLVIQILAAIPLVVMLLQGKLDLAAARDGEISLSPMLLLMTNVGLFLLIPIAMGAQKIAFGQSARFLHSVAGRVRRSWLLCCAAVIVPLWTAWLILSSLGEHGGRGSQLLAYFIVIASTTPLQAAGEEYAFRGLLNRTVAAWFRNRWAGLIVGATVSSLLFMAAHVAQDPWLNAYYFTLGLTFCAMAWRTGGLEMSIVLHTINNVVAFAITVWQGNMDKVMTRTTGTGSPELLLSVALALACLAGLEYWFRRRREIRAAAPGLAEIMDQPSAYRLTPPPLR